MILWLLDLPQYHITQLQDVLPVICITISSFIICCCTSRKKQHHCSRLN
uniref:Uncharacterized protein n=1 Tax=Arundo donax TaxID=35708 RepID=A0A0A9ALF5_ARUDO